MDVILNKKDMHVLKMQDSLSNRIGDVLMDNDMINSILAAQREIFKLTQDVESGSLSYEDIALKLQYISTFPLSNFLFMAFNPNNEMDANELEELIWSHVQSNDNLDADHLFVDMMLRNLNSKKEDEM